MILNSQFITIYNLQLILLLLPKKVKCSEWNERSKATVFIAYHLQVCLSYYKNSFPVAPELLDTGIILSSILCNTFLNSELLTTTKEKTLKTLMEQAVFVKH